MKFKTPLDLPNKVAHYDYDKVGNREQVTENAVTTTYKPNPLNQYDSINGQTLSYDLNGNLINNNGWNYQYDAQNRLITASNGITQATFAYDGRNRCVQRTINGITTYLYYDDWNLIEERDINDNLLASYVHGEKIDEIICRRVPGNTIYYHHDALGNVSLLTDDNGDLLEHYTYDAFGKPTILNATNGILQTSAYGNRFLFTGREYLPRLDLYDYRNRVYIPELGRFLQTDPIRFEAKDVNLYRYVFNNPINFIDPTGKIIWPLLAAALYVAAGGSYDLAQFDFVCDELEPGQCGYFSPLTGAGLSMIGGNPFMIRVCKSQDCECFVDDAGFASDPPGI